MVFQATFNITSVFIQMPDMLMCVYGTDKEKKLSPFRRIGAEGFCHAIAASARHQEIRRVFTCGPDAQGNRGDFAAFADY